MTRPFPVYAHNSTNYDNMLITQKIVEREGTNLKILAKSSEKYLCIQTSKFWFLDGYNLLPNKLSTLSEDLHFSDQYQMPLSKKMDTQYWYVPWKETAFSLYIFQFDR